MHLKELLIDKTTAGIQRITRQRTIILEELKKVTSHPSAEQLYQMVRRRVPNVSFGTIYRNLMILENSGLIQKLSYSNKPSRYDGTPDNHYHISCEKCGRVDDILMSPWKKLNEKASYATHYKIKSHRIEFYGLCPKCKNKGRR